MRPKIKKEFENLVNIYKLGNIDEAKKLCQSLLRKDPTNDFLLNLMGLFNQTAGKYEKSIQFFEKALHNNRNNVSARNNLGNSFKYIKKFDKAEEIFKRILNTNPNYINSIINLGNLRVETNKISEGINLFKNGLKVNNKIPLIYLNLAHAYQSIGKKKDAENILNQLLKFDPSNTKADKLLSSQINYSEDKNHLDIMLKKLDDKKVSDENKIYLMFAIGKAYEDIKDYPNSKKFIIKGNELKNKTYVKRNNYKNLSKSIINFFKNFNLTHSSKNQDKVIFIVGMPRSGTTLTENIIGNHRNTCGVGEINYLGNLFNMNIIENNEINLNTIDDFLKTEVNTEYFKFLENFRLDNNIPVDKSLDTFWYIGFIKFFFPNAKFLHCKRNSHDNCLSIFKNLFDADLEWAYDQLDLANYYNIYVEMMNFWNDKYKGEILNFNYEDLVNETENTIKNLLNFCDLEWDDNCLNFHKKSIPIKTLSAFQANRPIYKTSVNSSKIYEDELEILFSKLS